MNPKQLHIAHAVVALLFLWGCQFNASQTFSSTSIMDATAITKGSPVFQVSISANMDLVRYYDQHGNEVSVTVYSIGKAGKTWAIFHLTTGETLLVSTIDGMAYDITGYINSDFLYGVQRGDRIYFGHAYKHALYAISTTTGDILAINNPNADPIDFQQSANYPGFYVFENEIVLAIIQPTFKVILTPGSAAQLVIQNPPPNLSRNNALWDYVPVGNTPEIYDENGKLYEVRSEYLNNMGTWSSTYRLRRFNYYATPILISDNGCGQSFYSYGGSEDTIIGSISGSSIPTWFLNPKNKTDRNNQDQYIISPAGYIHVQPSIGGEISADFQAKDLSIINSNDYWLFQNSVYWKNTANTIQRIILSPAGTVEDIVLEQVLSWGIAGDYLIYNTANSTKRIDLNNVAGGSSIIEEPPIEISQFIKFNE